MSTSRSTFDAHAQGQVWVAIRLIAACSDTRDIRPWPRSLCGSDLGTPPAAAARRQTPAASTPFRFGDDWQLRQIRKAACGPIRMATRRYRHSKRLDPVRKSALPKSKCAIGDRGLRAKPFGGQMPRMSLGQGRGVRRQQSPPGGAPGSVLSRGAQTRLAAAIASVAQVT